MSRQLGQAPRRASRPPSLMAPRRGTGLICPETRDGSSQGPEEPQARPPPPGTPVSRSTSGLTQKCSNPEKGNFYLIRVLLKKKIAFCCIFSYNDIAAGSLLVVLRVLQTPAPKKSPT